MEGPPRTEQASEDFSKMLGRKLLGRSSKTRSKAQTVFNLGGAKEVEMKGMIEVEAIKSEGSQAVVWNGESAQVSGA